MISIFSMAHLHVEPIPKRRPKKRAWTATPVVTQEKEEEKEEEKPSMVAEKTEEKLPPAQAASQAPPWRLSVANLSVAIPKRRPTPKTTATQEQKEVKPPGKAEEQAEIKPPEKAEKAEIKPPEKAEVNPPEKAEEQAEVNPPEKADSVASQQSVHNSKQGLYKVVADSWLQLARQRLLTLLVDMKPRLKRRRLREDDSADDAECVEVDYF